MVQFNSMCFSGLTIAMSLGMSPTLNAGCPCNASGGSSFSGAALAPIPYQVSPYDAHHAPIAQYPTGPSSYGGGVGWGASPLMPAPFAQVQVNTPAPSPPPGTIGQTYKLPSRPVPVEKHPRVGMIDVKVMDAEEVIVHDMNAMRTEATIAGFRDAEDPNVWHFESKPLYPGLDHVYRIQATHKNPDGTKTKSERYVRLIMGRVVELVF